MKSVGELKNIPKNDVAHERVSALVGMSPVFLVRKWSLILGGFDAI